MPTLSASLLHPAQCFALKLAMGSSCPCDASSLQCPSVLAFSRLKTPFDEASSLGSRARAKGTLVRNASKCSPPRGNDAPASPEIPSPPRLWLSPPAVRHRANVPQTLFPNALMARRFVQDFDGGPCCLQFGCFAQRGYFPLGDERLKGTLLLSPAQDALPLFLDKAEEPAIAGGGDVQVGATLAAAAESTSNSAVRAFGVKNM